jgi:hypothetical protein
MSFADLKRNSSSNFEKLNKELNKLNSNTSDRGEIENLWKPATDKVGNGYAVIRFLPAPANEDVPFVRIWDHGFQGTGGWYIEKSLTTFGENDPVGELNSQLWNSGSDADKEIARKQKRRLSYYSNVYIVKDPSNPENEGKVFLFKYGKKIFDKLNDLMNPSFADEKPVNPFDLWTGANFKLKIRKLEGYPNYDKSEFDSAGPLSEDDDELEAIYKKEHSLQALLDRKNFKTYDELKARLDRALGITTAPASKARASAEEAPAWEPKAAAAPKFAETATPSSGDEEEDDLAFFRSLTEDDD